MTKKILITGAAGFLGRNVVTYLSGRGYAVTGTWNHLEPGRNSEHIRYCQVDLGNKEEVRGLLSSLSFDAVIHLAGQMRGKSVRDFLRNSVDSTKYLTDFARESKVRTFIYASSISIYGNTGIVDENADRVNLDDYGTAKYICERLLEDSEIENRIVIRLPRMLGRGADLSYPWLPKLAGNLMKNKDIEYFNPELLYNNLAHTDTLSEFLSRILEDEKGTWKGFHVMGIGAARPVRVIDIIRQMKRELNSLSPLHEVKECLPRHTCFLIDISRAVKYGYIPWTVEKTVANFVEDLKISV